MGSRTTLVLLVSGGSTLGLLGSSVAQAQNTGASTGAQPTGLQEIVVTAEKRSQSVNSVPMSITATTGAELRNLGVHDVSDLAKIVPSFQATIDRTSPVYTLRGVGFYSNTYGARPAVGIYVDEVELPFAIMAKGVTLDLERVEVLKGPQGTLFGQNATSGLINYIAAKPTDTLHYGGEMSIGRFDQGDVEAFVSGPLTDTLSIRVAGRQDFGQGWQYSYTRPDRLGVRNTTSSRILLDWKPSGEIKFELSLNGWDDRSDSLAGQLLLVRKHSGGTLPAELVDYPLPPHSDGAADWTPDDYRSDLKFRQVALRGDIDLGAIGTLTSISAYSHMNIYAREDSDGTVVENETHTERGTEATASQELRLAGKINDRLSYIVGANYAWYKAYQNERIDVPNSSVTDTFAAFGVAGSFSAIGDFADSHYRTASAFASTDYKLTETLTAHAGIRYSHTSANGTGCTLDENGVGAQGFGALFSFLRSTLTQPLGPVTIAPGGCVSAGPEFVPGLATPRFKEHSLPFRVGLDWKPGHGALLYANVSRGFKGGSFPVIGATSNTQFDAATQEKLTAYEAGFKVALMDRRLQVNGAAFYYDYSNKQFLGQVFDQVFGSLEKLVNIPKSHVLGAELQVNWAPIDGLAMNGGVTYLKTRIDGCSSVNAGPGEVGCEADGYHNYDDFGMLARLTGERFPYAPTWSGTADIEYKWNAGGVRPFVGATVHGQTGTIAQLGQQPQLGAADPSQVLKLQAYALLDLRAGIEGQNGRWRIMLWGRNVTDKYYRVGANAVNDTTIGYTGNPATYGVTMSFRY